VAKIEILMGQIGIFDLAQWGENAPF